MATTNSYAVGPKRVNHAPVSPLNFLKCVVRVYPKRISVIQGGKQYTRKERDNRCRALASDLNNRGIGKGDTVMLANTCSHVRLPLRPALPPRIPCDEQARRASSEQRSKYELLTKSFKYVIASPHNQRR